MAELLRHYLIDKQVGQLAELRTLFDLLCRHLADSGEVASKSSEFALLGSNLDRVDFTLALLDCFGVKDGTFDGFKVIFENGDVDGGKNLQTSLELRQKGNLFYQKKDYDKAILYYNACVAFAQENTEEFGVGFANRSAVWFEIGRFQECLNDINKALKNNYPEKLQPKLLKRKSNAEQKVKNQLKTSICEEIPNLKHASNPTIQSSSSAVKIEENETFGRFVVANEDIKVGDVLAVEKPYTSVPVLNCLMTHCLHCQKLCFELAPCKNCSTCVFCSENCKLTAWNEYHKYECTTMANLICLNISTLSYLGFKVAIKAKSDYCSVHEFNTKVNNSIEYKSDRYQEIHALVPNTDQRTTGDLFKRAFEAAVIFKLFKMKSEEFFTSQEDEDVFKEVLLLHLQTGPSNFHEISNLELTKFGLYTTEEIGAGAFSFLSLLNHSCSPNVVRHCYGSTVVLRALQPIKKGQQLFDNYGYHFAVQCKEERMKKLQEQYCFICQCPACGEDWSQYKSLIDLEESQKFRTKDYVLETSKKLQLCDLEFAKDEVDYLEKLAEEYDYANYPSKWICDVQELLKQCYAIFGSKKIYGNMVKFEDSD